MKALTTLAVSIILIFSTQTLAEEVKMNINDVIIEYGKLLNASDTESILKLYSKDPVFMPQHEPAQIGRDQVRGAYKQVFDTIKLNITFTVHEIEEFDDDGLMRRRDMSANDIPIRESERRL